MQSKTTRTLLNCFQPVWRQTLRLERPQIVQLRLLGEWLPQVLAESILPGLSLPTGRIGVLLAGDFYTVPTLDKRGGSGDVTTVWQAFGEHFSWVVGVAGNHDTFGDQAKPPNFRKPFHFLDKHSVTDLTHFQTSGCNVTDTTLEFLKELPRLREVGIGDRPGITDAGLTTLKQFPELRVLHLGGSSITDAGLTHFRDFKKLSVLGFSGIAELTDDGLVQIAALKTCASWIWRSPELETRLRERSARTVISRN